MKKFLAVILVFVISLSCAGCGNKLQKQADDVAAILEGKWSATWNAPLGKMEEVYIFKNVDGNAGQFEHIYKCNGEVLTHYTGTFGVSIQEDGVIDYSHMAKIDSKGNISKLEKTLSYTISYTYEDGKVKLMDDSRSYTKK